MFFSNLKWRLNQWLFWKLTGWPFNRRCPQCAGSGTYATETMARYGDKAHTCDVCLGTGLIRRRQYKY